MIIGFEQRTQHDAPRVGGKNASLGEMIQHVGALKVRVPRGFAVTANAYREYPAFNEIEPVLRAEPDRLAQGEPLHQVGSAIRGVLSAGTLPPALESQIRDAYTELGRRSELSDPPVAVRSSATAEDLPEASFAGQQVTFLNVVGVEPLLEAVVRCSETGFRNMVVINGAWGLGKTVVKGTVTADEWRVFKPLLDTPNVTPILDHRSGTKLVKLVLSAEGEPVKIDTTSQQRDRLVLSDECVRELARWCARKTSGRVFVLSSMAEAERFEDGGIPVARLTDTDWVPLMKRASAIVTDSGGRTSHAAIVSRELGIAALEVYVVAEIPSKIILTREFGARFDGFNIGSNDLTPRTLGVDRDNALLADLFDDRNPSVLRSIEPLIADAHAVGCKVGICGQAPSDHPEFAEFQVRAGIDSISLNPDSVVPVLNRVAALEADLAIESRTAVS